MSTLVTFSSSFNYFKKKPQFVPSNMNVLRTKSARTIYPAGRIVVVM